MALFASARAKPCNAACSSEVRSARSSSPSSLKLIPEGIGVFSVPFGPLTSSSRSWTVIVTPLGTAITFFPIRDICLFPISNFELRICQSVNSISHFEIRNQLIDLGQQLAADVFAARGFAAHQTLRSEERRVGKEGRARWATAAATKEQEIYSRHQHKQ